MKEDQDILFLTETDIKLNDQEDYSIKGFKKIIQKRNPSVNMVRLLGLVKNDFMNDITIMDSLMSSDFSSIWLSYDERNRGYLRNAGFYREWSHLENRTENNQVVLINKFIEQIEQVAVNKSKLIIAGDAYFCENKWKDIDYTHRKVSSPLINCLEQSGLIIKKLGNTYQADHKLANGTVPASAFNHIYSST